MEVLEIVAGLAPDRSRAAPTRILWMGGDARTRAAGGDLLRRDGRELMMVDDPAAAREALGLSAWDLAVLHLHLTDAAHMALCRELCATGLSVLVIPEASDLNTRIAALDLGIAGLLPPSPHPLELAAHVQAATRRRAPVAQAAAAPRWRFDLGLGCVQAPSGRMVRLGRPESALLRAFTVRPGRILSRQELSELLRDQGAPADSRLIHARVSRLRLALTPCDGAEDLIRTLRGGGYLLHATVRAAA
ncbi:MAG: winged helix-turn-helix domain-containing protein [Pseudomonadota bacterium]